MRTDKAHDEPPLRCRQPGVTRDGLDRHVADFEAHFRQVPPHGPHLRWWIARYSRGDALSGLRDDFADIAEWVERDGQAGRARFGDGALLFAYGRGNIGCYRDALVLLSIALCLRLPEAARVVLRWCERGDPLVELLAESNGAPRAEREAAPPFPAAFDGLYAALQAAAPDAATAALHDYLAVWCDERMDDMGFKLSDRGIGYWCFEAAGVAAALAIDDGALRGDPHYPADLAAFHRTEADR